MRVVIGEDEALLREGLALIVGRSEFELAGAAEDADALVALVAQAQPDVVVTDIRMPPQCTDDGLRAALEIRRRWPQTAVLALSQHVHRRYAQELLGDRPAGVAYLLKQRVGDVSAFLGALRTVAAGGAVIDHEVVRIMLDRSARHDGDLAALTARQRGVLGLLRGVQQRRDRPAPGRHREGDRRALLKDLPCAWPCAHTRRAPPRAGRRAPPRGVSPKRFAADRGDRGQPGGHRKPQPTVGEPRQSLTTSR